MATGCGKKIEDRDSWAEDQKVEEQGTGHQNPCWTRWQPSGPQLPSHDEGSLMPSPGTQAERSPVLRTLQKGLSGLHEGPSVLYLGSVPRGYS